MTAPEETPLPIAILPGWMRSKRYRDLHPQGVVFIDPDHTPTPGRLELGPQCETLDGRSWTFYRSHRSEDRARAAADTLNAMAPGFLARCTFLAVRFR